MEIYKPPSACLLRRFRQRKKLTLEEAATFLDISASALSRKERGEKPVERPDIRNAIDAYNLTEWEADELWMSAGFVPERQKPYFPNAHIGGLFEPLLENISHPAAVIDQIGYIRAWNSEYEAIWQLADTVPSPHIVDQFWRRQELFTSHSSWNRRVLHALRTFYYRSLRATGRPEFQAVLKRLKESYGDEFVQRWNLAQNYSSMFGTDDQEDANLVMDSYGVTICHKKSGDAGSGTCIEYLIMQSMLESLTDYDLTIYVPFGDINQRRYHDWRLHLNQSGVYCS